MPPGRAFDVLDGLLGTLERKLDVIRQGVAYREALAAATPALWPADGWISGTYGYRSDPFTGLRDFHAAVDISTRKGQPVYAPATGRVMSAASNGAYGNLVELDHGFGLTTRYGHLSGFAVRVGETVRRGQLIGYVGATGRATGSHVHYEVWVNGRERSTRCGCSKHGPWRPISSYPALLYIAPGFSWTLDCEKVLAGGVSR